MNTKIAFACIALMTLPGFAKSTCYASRELKGRDEMVQKFIHGPEAEAAKIFVQFCRTNAGKVKCSRTTVPNSQARQMTAKIMAGKNCGQLSPIVHQNNTTTLYFFDSLRN